MAMSTHYSSVTAGQDVTSLSPLSDAYEIYAYLPENGEFRRLELTLRSRQARIALPRFIRPLK